MSSERVVDDARLPRVSVELGPVQETLLIPLYGRAMETRRKNGLLCDEKAKEIQESLNYDFGKWRKTGSPLGACLRTVMFDEYVRAFLNEHPLGTVVEVGCGLNTRFERIDNGRATWFELDLPDSMALRRQFFDDEPRRTMIDANVLETDWMARVAATGGPWCFVSEAVLIYLDAHDVETVLRNLATRFSGSWLVMDTASQRMRDTQATHDVMKTMPKASWFRWACDDPDALDRWGARLVTSRSFLNASAPLKRRLPLTLRLAVTFFPFLMRRKMMGYKLNRFALETPGIDARVGPA
ncbi:MAG: class I SAM-dependent methyltransferase [Pseudomonadota bacterium]